MDRRTAAQFLAVGSVLVLVAYADDHSLAGSAMPDPAVLPRALAGGAAVVGGCLLAMLGLERVGSGILALWRVSTAGPVARFTAGLVWVMTGAVVLLAAGFLRPWSGVVLALPLLIGLWRWRHEDGETVLTGVHWSSWAVLLGFGALAGAFALAPSVAHDDHVYHLPAIREFMEHGSLWQPSPQPNVHRPLVHAAVLAWVRLVGGDTLGGLGNLFFLVAAGLLLARKNGIAGTVGLLAWVSNPELVFLAGTSYAEPCQCLVLVLLCLHLGPPPDPVPAEGAGLLPAGHGGCGLAGPDGVRPTGGRKGFPFAATDGGAKRQFRASQRGPPPDPGSPPPTSSIAGLADGASSFSPCGVETAGAEGRSPTPSDQAPAMGHRTGFPVGSPASPLPDPFVAGPLRLSFWLGGLLAGLLPATKYSGLFLLPVAVLLAFARSRQVGAVAGRREAGRDPVPTDRMSEGLPLCCPGWRRETEVSRLAKGPSRVAGGNGGFAPVDGADRQDVGRASPVPPRMAARNGSFAHRPGSDRHDAGSDPLPLRVAAPKAGFAPADGARPGWRPFLLGGLVSLALVAAPFYWRNLVMTGNPLYPHASSWFAGGKGGFGLSFDGLATGTTDLIDFSYEGFTDRFGMGRDPWNLVWAPWNVIVHGQFHDERFPLRFFDGQLGPFVLVFWLLLLASFAGLPAVGRVGGGSGPSLGGVTPPADSGAAGSHPTVGWPGATAVPRAIVGPGETVEPGTLGESQVTARPGADAGSREETGPEASSVEAHPPTMGEVQGEGSGPWVILLAAGWLLVCWLAGSHQVRFLLPLVAFAAWAVPWLLRSRPTLPLAFWVVLGLLASPWTVSYAFGRIARVAPFLSGRLDCEGFLVSRLPCHAGFTWANRNLSGPGRLLVLFEERTHLLRRPFLWTGLMPYAFINFLHRSGSAATAERLLKAQGVGAVLLPRVGSRLLQEVQGEVFQRVRQDLFGDRLRPVYADSQCEILAWKEP